MQCNLLMQSLMHDFGSSLLEKFLTTKERAIVEKLLYLPRTQKPEKYKYMRSIWGNWN